MSRITELSQIIASNTAIIEEHLQKHNIPTPSFETGLPHQLLSDRKLSQAHQAVEEASLELHELVQVPEAFIFKQLYPNAAPLLSLLSTFPILPLFTADPSCTVTYAQIAESTKLPVNIIERIFKLGIANRVFRQVGKGVVGHTAASRALVENRGLRNMTVVGSRMLWPSSAHISEALERWPEGQESNRAAFQIANSTTDDVFGYISKKDPYLAETFGGAMEFFSQNPGFSPKHTVNGFPWSELASSEGKKGILKVVDIGGSNGMYAFAIAEAHPSVDVTIQDRPEVVEANTALIPKALEDRVRYMEHDIFKDIQPIKGADVYFLRWILHDWSDTACIGLLRKLIPAMKKGARVVLNEWVVSEPGEVPVADERLVRALDIFMMAMSNGKERNEDDWKALFKATDERFEVVATRQPEGAYLGIVEAVWKGDTQF